MRLSQTQLQTLSDCPRQFQYRYLEQLAEPIAPEIQASLLAGSQFHRVVQQWQMGLPIEAIVTDNPHLQTWFNRLLQQQAQIFSLSTEASQTCHSEYRLTLDWRGQTLVVVYDALLLGDRSAQILDWKTYGKPRTNEPLAAHWQTRLYLYVLAEVLGYAPEQLAMVYWFFGGKTESAQFLRFSYDRAQHQQTADDLADLLGRLSQELESYEQDAVALSQVSIESPLCAECAFAGRCQRASFTPTRAQRLLETDLADLPEILVAEIAS